MARRRKDGSLQPAPPKSHPTPSGRDSTAKMFGPSSRPAPAGPAPAGPAPAAEPWWPTWLILGLALIVRLIYLLDFETSPLFNNLVLDEKNYHEWALRIAHGDIVGQGTFTANPLGPYMVGFVYALFGDGFWTIRLVQVLVNCVSIFFIFQTTRHLFGTRAGWAAMALATLYAPLIFCSANLVGEVWVVFFASAGLALLTAPRWNFISGFFAGVLLALSALGRPNLLPLALLLPFARLIADPLFEKAGRRQLSHRFILSTVFPYIAGISVVLTPMLVRNIVLGGEAVLITSHGGVNLWIGNNADADGFFRTPRGSGLAGGQESLITSSIRVAEKAAGRKLSSSEASRFWVRRVETFIMEHPGTFFDLILLKTVYFINDYEKPLESNLYYGKSISPLLAYGTFGFGTLAPLAVIGFYLERRRWRSFAILLAYALAYSLTVIAYFVSMRYRLPLVLVLFPPAGAAIVNLVKLLADRTLSHQKGLGLVAIVAIVLTNWPIAAANLEHDIAHTSFILGNVLGDQGKKVEALEQYERAVALYPEWGGFYNNLALAYLKNDRPDDAIVALERAIKLDYAERRVYRNLAKAHKVKGDLNQAEASYRKALTFNRKHAATYLDLGQVLQQQGKKLEAEEVYREALRQVAANARPPIEMALKALTSGTGTAAVDSDDAEDEP